jgi:hypothetical protein
MYIEIFFQSNKYWRLISIIAGNRQSNLSIFNYYQMNPPICQIRFSLGLVMTMHYFVKLKIYFKVLMQEISRDCIIVKKKWLQRHLAKPS